MEVLNGDVFLVKTTPCIGLNWQDIKLERCSARGPVSPEKYKDEVCAGLPGELSGAGPDGIVVRHKY